jgi:DNA-directed RNA polymerase subunit N (RpoN/RPB10)
MAICYPSVSATCSCVDSNGLPTKLGERQKEYETFLSSTPTNTEALRRMGVKWKDLGVEPMSWKPVSQEVQAKLLSSASGNEKHKEFEAIMKTVLLPAEAVNRMGVKRMCCRKNFINPTQLLFVDRNSGRYEDSSNPNYPILVDGETPTPKRQVPALPSMMNYSQVNF